MAGVPRICVRGDVGDHGRALLHAHPAFECEGVSGGVVAGLLHATPTRLRARGALGWGGRALLHVHPMFACEGVSGRGRSRIVACSPHAFASEGR